MDFRRYKRRLLNGSKSFFENTSKYLNDSFTQSPFYSTIWLGEKEIDAIINDTNSVDEKNILLRPKNAIDKGEVIEYKNHDWLVMDFNEDQVYPTLKVRLCNQILKSVTDGSEIPVVAIGKRTDFDEEEDYLIVTTNEITVFASFQLANHIKLTDRFTMNNSGFEVIGIDNVTEVFQDKGVVKFTMDVTEIPVTPPAEPIDENTPTENTDGGWGDW
jgi:hypothetical protein